MSDERCALLTGAARGIGAASARALAGDGWSVAVNYRSDAEAAEALVTGIEADGGTAAAIAGDLNEPKAVDALFEAATERCGPVLALVNNAGIRADGLSPQIDDAAWDVVIETNLSLAFRCSRRALPTMLRRRFGRIVNVASVVGPRANAGQANYAASKAGLIGMTRTIAVEVARRGVTVNAVAPGLVETKLTEGIGEEAMGEIPVRRPARPEEIAAAVRFLASEDASYVTGTTLTVDGGLSA